MMGKRGQVTVFIIIALILVSAVALYFLFRGNIISVAIPASLQPAYTGFLTCMEDYTLSGIDILESQAGYIELPDYDLGSPYIPFSSQLDFSGNPVPYWYYISGSNVQKTQVPTKQEMENQLAAFIDTKIRDCNLQAYYDSGFVISEEEPTTKVTINEDSVDVRMNMGLTIQKGEETANVKSHQKTINSNLGGLYDSAARIYDYEQDTLFLENYGIDTLRAYAPVDGVNISCSPGLWNADDVFSDLNEGIEANTLALRTAGGNYVLSSEENNYFVVDVPVDNEVRFVTSRAWPSNFEVSPSEGNVLLATPVGNQPGLGILGFCYVPYHFVYNLKYPVLVQVYKGEEVFQFPMAVVIQGNQPRQALPDGINSEMPSPDLCMYKNTPVEVSVYDNNYNPIDAQVSYKCFGEVCPIGSTLSGNLKQNFPQCANGYVVAQAPGFKDAEILYSTTIEGSVQIFMTRIHELNIDLNLDGKPYVGQALVSFVSEEYSRSAVWPDQKTIELTEGQYKVQAYIYKNSSIQLQESTTQKCLEIPDSGIGGVFGLTKQKCFDLVIPEQIVSNALAGGGEQNYYASDSELGKSSTVKIKASSLPTPSSIYELQDNYELFSNAQLEVAFN